MYQRGYRLSALPLAIFISFANELSAGNKWMDHELRSYASDHGPMLDLQEILLGSLTRGLKFGRTHLSNKSNSEFPYVTPIRQTTIQLLHALLTKNEALTKLLLQTAKNVKPDKATELYTWLVENFTFNKKEIKFASKYYHEWNTGIAPVFDQVMVEMGGRFGLVGNASEFSSGERKKDLVDIIMRNEDSKSPEVSDGLWELSKNDKISNYFLVIEELNMLTDITNNNLTGSEGVIEIGFTGIDSLAIQALFPDLIAIKSTKELTDKVLAKKMLTVVLELVQVGYPINKFQNDGLNLLYKSIKNKNKDLTSVLIEKGADVQASTNCDRTLLHIAAYKRSAHISKELLDLGANMYAMDCQGMTPMHVAILNEDEDVISVLIENNFDFDKIFMNGNTLIHFVAANGSVEILRTLPGTLYDLENNDGMTPLLEALVRGRPDIAIEIIQHGANISRTYQDGSTYLHKATELSSEAAAHFLLNYGLDVDKENNKGETPLLMAIKRNNVVLIDIFLQKDPKVEYIENGKVYLNEAVKSKSKEAVEKLLKSGIPADGKDSKGRIPLVEAVMVDDPETMRVLMSFGAKVYQRIGNTSRTLLHVAAKCGCLNALSFLIENGLFVDEKDSEGRTPLHDASEAGHVSVVKLLISKGCDVSSSTNSKKYNSLQLASKNGHFGIIKELIAHGANVHSRNMDGWTALHEASFNGHGHIVKELLSKGAHIDSRTDGNKYNALHLASMRGHLLVVRELLSRGADVNTRNSHGWSALHEAASHGHLPVLKEIISKGVEVDVKTTDEYYTPLILASKSGHVHVVETLISKGASIEAKNKNGCSALHEASANDHVFVIRVLLNNSADVNSVTYDKKYTPLQVASKKGHLSSVTELISAGANIIHMNMDGYAAIHEASINGHVGVVKELIAHGANVDTPTATGSSPLILASMEGHLVVVKELISKGAKLTIRQVDGRTALHEAASYGHLEVLQELIHNGAEVQAETNKGDTPLHLASKYGHLDVVVALISRGAEINSKTRSGYTPLHEASYNGHLAVVRELLSKRAEVDATTNDNNYTPLYLASINNHLDVVKELIDHGSDAMMATKDGVTVLEKIVQLGNVDIFKEILNEGAALDVRQEGKDSLLHIAAQNGRVEILKELFSRGAHVDTIDQLSGFSALHCAVKSGHLEAVRALLSEGADPNLPTTGNVKYTSLQLAAAEGHLNVVEELLNRGAKVQIEDLDAAYKAGRQEIVKELVLRLAESNSTSTEYKPLYPLHIAAKYGNLDAFRRISQKVDVNTKDDDGKTALHEAASEGQIHIVKDLLSKGADVNARDRDRLTPLSYAKHHKQQPVVELLKYWGGID